MSYNFDYTDTTKPHSAISIISDGLHTTDATELFDAILSRQDYSHDGVNYERTDADSDTLRAEIIDLLNNKNVNYLQLIGYTAIQLINQIDFDNFATHLSDDINIFDFWYAASLANKSSFSIDELLAFEKHLGNFDDILYMNDFKIGDYSGDMLFDIFNLVVTLRPKFAKDATLTNFKFVIA